MTAEATLTGLNAALVNVAMKSKLTDAFASATGAPKVAVRIGAVTDVVMATTVAVRRRRLMQASSTGVTVWPRMFTHPRSIRRLVPEALRPTCFHDTTSSFCFVNFLNVHDIGAATFRWNTSWNRLTPQSSRLRPVLSAAAALVPLLSWWLSFPSSRRQASQPRWIRFLRRW